MLWVYLHDSFSCYEVDRSNNSFVFSDIVVPLDSLRLQKMFTSVDSHKKPEIIYENGSFKVCEIIIHPDYSFRLREIVP